MRPTNLLIPTLAFALLSSASSAFAQQYYGPPSFAYAHGDVEEAMEQRGFRDGVVGAEHDFKNHRRPDVNNRDEYRNPSFIPGWAQNEYREGFRRGYSIRAREIYYGEAPRHGYDR